MSSPFRPRSVLERSAERVASDACRALLSVGALLVLARAARADLLLGEVYYHPAGVDGSDREFVELSNEGPDPVDLRGWAFTDGIEFVFIEGAPVAPGERIVIARRPELWVGATSGARVFGPFSGQLDDGGERLALSRPDGTVADELTWDNDWPFPREADGGGASLERRCFTHPSGAPFLWRASPPSPGSAPLELDCTLAPVAPDLDRFPVVLNEIHYHPAEDPSGVSPPFEYVELFNRSDRLVDLAGWRFDRGIAFEFPAGAMLESGGLLVVAEDPVDLAETFALDSARVFGPFADGSQLDNGGERIRLLDSQGRVADEVEYDDEKPWPAFADGLGGTLQRVDPLGPSGSPGNWRVGRHPGEGGETNEWRVFEQRALHAGPRLYIYLLGPGELRLDDISLTDDEGTEYVSNGSFDLGFDGWEGTDSHAASSWVATGGYGDDGPCVVLRATEAGNGFRGLRYSFDPRPPEDVSLTLRLRVRAVSGETHFIARSSIARGGDGLLWIEGDALSGESRSEAGSPLAPNAVGGSGTPPTVLFASREPARPGSIDSVTIASRVIHDAVARVIVRWRLDEGATLESEMHDDGADGDAVAGDGLWSVRLPPAPDKSLVWFEIEAVSESGSRTSWPRRRDPAEVVGYWVDDDLPEENDTLRLFHIFTPGALNDLTCADGQYRAGSFVDHHGRAYYGIGVKNRGETACNYPKRPIRLRFNRGDRFEGQRRLNLNAGWNDKSMLREKVGFDFFRDAGVGYSETHFARVHTNGGRFFGVFFTVEDPNEDYLRRNRRDTEGGLYKSRTPLLNSDTSRLEPRTLASRTRFGEVRTFADSLNRLQGAALVGFLNDALDVEAFIDYQAVQVITIDGDSVVKNWLLYLGHHELDPLARDRVTAFPWDIDLSFGQMLLTTDVRNYDIHPMFQTRSFPFHDQGYHGIITALLETAPDDYYVKAYYGRMWTLLEEKFRPDILIPKVDELDRATIGAVREDLTRWRRWGNEPGNPDFWRADFRRFIERRYAFLSAFLSEERPTTRGRTFRYVPAPRVKFTEIHYNPPGDDELEFVELSSLEDREVDVSGWDIEALGWVFPDGSVLGPRETVLVANDPARIRSAFGLAPDLSIFGPAPFRVPNDGCVLRLRDDGDGGRYYPETIDIVVFEDSSPWPSRADGDGASLELVRSDADNDFATEWRAGWSPGRAAERNADPVALIRLLPPSGPTPLRVVADASESSDPDGDDLSFSWELPDGSNDARRALVLDFAAPGDYSLRLTVRDRFGGESSAEENIHAGASEEALFRRGDANDDGAVDLSDAVRVLEVLFLGRGELACADAADTNDDGKINISDPVALLLHLFGGGDAIPSPGPECGADPTPDALDPCDAACGR